MEELTLEMMMPEDLDKGCEQAAALMRTLKNWPIEGQQQMLESLQAIYKTLADQYDQKMEERTSILDEIEELLLDKDMRTYSIPNLLRRLAYDGYDLNDYDMMDIKWASKPDVQTCLRVLEKRKVIEPTEYGNWKILRLI